MRAKRNLTFPIRYSAYVARACVSALAARNQTNRLFDTIIARSLYTMVLRGYLYISLQSSLLYAGLQECSTRVKSKIKGRSRQTRYTCHSCCCSRNRRWTKTPHTARYSDKTSTNYCSKSAVRSNRARYRTLGMQSD